MKAMSSPLPVSLGLLLILLSFSPFSSSIFSLLATCHLLSPGTWPDSPATARTSMDLMNLVTVAEHPHLSQAPQIPLWPSYHCGLREITQANRERHFNACATCHFFTRQMCARHFLGTKQLRAHFTRSIHSIPEGKVKRQS